MRHFQTCILLAIWTVFQHIGEINTVIGDSSDGEVDDFIDEYVNEVKRTLRLGLEEHVINKRSHPNVDFNKLTGLELLDGFQEMHTIPAKFPRDIILFSHCPLDQKQWYSAALETKVEKKNNVQVIELVLYKYQRGEWAETHRVMAAGGESIAVEQIQGSMFLVVAQHLADEDIGSTVWHLHSDSDMLQFVHKLPTHHASHAIMWTDTYTSYAAVAISENVAGSEKRFSTQSPVYRWIGSYFDMIDVLPTYNPRALVQFNIRSSMFIAVANFQNDLGEKMIDSEIFRYDLTSDKFNIYQKLPTEAAIDIKYFCFKSNEITESFLIYASAFHTDEKGNKDFNAPSVVYKLSNEEYFIPFQALQVSKVSSWLPVLQVKDGLESLTLIGASEAGIISFQYDGWRFVLTGLYDDRYSFGPGFKSLNAFYNSDQTLISVANKESDGYEINVFSPVFKNNSGVENAQKIISKWVEEMTQEVIAGEIKIRKLIRTVREAPSINDTMIELGSHVEFRNAEINELETLVTKVGDSDADAEVYRRLYELKIELENLQQTLMELPARIDQTSLHTYSVYEDRIEDVADITCTHTCHVTELEVLNVNGENLTDFMANTVNIKEPVEFEEEISFNDLALVEPLNTTMINGHLRETLIDWSREVIIDHELKVEGDVIAEHSVSVTEAVDGVLVNVNRKEESVEPDVIVSPTRDLESLNTSKLALSDGKISEVDFKRFVLSTLKTHGDQVFTESQDVDRIEADEVIADVYKAYPHFPTVLQQRNCEDENCSEFSDLSYDSESRGRASVGDQHIESYSLLDDVIIIPRNITLYGTMIVENGSLSANDFIDLKQDVSAVKLSEFSILLNQSVIAQHVKFDGGLKTPMLNVDTLNSLPLTSLVNVEDRDTIRLSGKKMFQGLLAVNGVLHMNGTVNGISLAHWEEEEENLEQVEFDNFNVNQISSRNLKLGEHDWHKRVIIRKDGTVVLKTLNTAENVVARHVTVQGYINNYKLENLLNDTVFEDDDSLLITGSKHFNGEIEIQNLSINPSNIMNLNFVTPESYWKKRLSKAKSIEVEKLFYTGRLDGVEAAEFGQWLLIEGDQNVTASQTFTYLQANNVAMSPNATFNSVNIAHLFSQAILISDNATFDSVVFEESVDCPEVKVGGKIGDLEISDIVVTDPTVDQLITGHKRVRGDVSVAGDLHTFGLVSDVNLTAYCQALSSDDTNLAISGDGKFKEEPEILVSVNNIEWPHLMRNIWFKDDNVTINGTIFMNEAEFEKMTVVSIKNNKVEEKLSKLISLSRDQDINGRFYFSDVQAKKGLRAGAASVGGDVQGIQLPSFLKNVLLNGEDQEIEAYLDFQSLFIQSPFFNKGFVSGLNLSSDVMLADVASNAMSAELTLEELSTQDLRLPPGASVAGVDIGRWNRTAVTKSAESSVITGDVTIIGQFDSSRGIRVEHLVNGLPYDEEHVMLLNTSQVVTGKKKFSAESDLVIHNLQVSGFLYGLNITDFYQQQVTPSGDVMISGHKKFTAPIWSGRAVLPEIYQEHNLTWLESELSAPLPNSSYVGQQATIHHFHQLASQSIAGRPYFLRNMTRVRDVEGDILFTLPLKSGNASVLAVIRRDADGHGITLSMLHWNDEQNMFLHMPGDGKYFPKVVPYGVQMITLPGGELASYVTSYLPLNSTSSEEHGALLRLKDGQITQTKIYWGKPGSTLLSFFDYKARTCFVVVEKRCRVYCHEGGRPTVRLPSFSCKNVSKATLFTTDRGLYVLGVLTRSQGSLLLWRMSGRRFNLVLELPQFNPVSIAATTSTGPHIAVANIHQLGHSRPETVDIYRLDENTSQMQLQQSLPVVSPHIVVFSSLPTSESILYVASVAPASTLQVYIFRGILGYQLFTKDPTLSPPSDLQPFTDHHQRHFLVVPSQHTASVLRGHF